MIPKILTQIWLGGKPPEDIQRMIPTVWVHHPEWQCVLLGDDDMRRFGLNVDRLRDEFGTWAAVTNFVRLIVLQRHGGFYLDTDFICHKPLDPLLQMGECLAAEQDGGRICNAVLAAIPNHPWVNWQLAHMGDFDRRDAASGVYLATAAPRDLVTLVPQRLVYPYLYDSPPEKRVPHTDSLLEHAWVGSWSQK